MKKEILNNDNVIQIIQENLVEGLVSCIKDTWRSGIDQIVKNVVANNEELIQNKYDKILKSVLNSSGFEKAITEEFKHKVAKNMVAKLEGQVEQAVNVIRQDQTLRAKMIVAIEKIIEENS